MDRIKNIFIEKDLETYLDNLGINYKKYQKNRIMQSIFIIIVFLFQCVYLM